MILSEILIIICHNFGGLLLLLPALDPDSMFRNIKGIYAIIHVMGYKPIANQHKFTTKATVPIISDLQLHPTHLVYMLQSNSLCVF